MPRRLLIAGLGLPACAALLTGAVTFVIYSYLQGEPPGGADLAGALVFGLLSLVVVLLALRGSKTRAAPMLLLVGAVAGAVGSVLFSREHFESLDDSRKAYCRESLGARTTDETLAVCMPEARSCDAELDRTAPDSSYDQMMRDCIDRRIGALELMGKLPEVRPSGEAPVRPVYPAEVGVVPPLVERLCDVLHGFPKRRKAECCQRQPGVIVTSECSRNLAGALRENGVTLAETDVAACEKAMRSAHQTCDWIGPHSPPVPEACLGIVRGARKQGDICGSSLECQVGFVCLGAGPTEHGRCTKPSNSGSPCNTAVDTLAVYLRQDDFERRHPACSDGFCDRNRCVGKVRTGGDCKANDQCLFGRCAEGRCVDEPTADVGEACSGGDCIEGSRCVEGKCIELKSIGADCTSSGECKAACIEGKCKLGCDDAPLLKKLSPPPAPQKDAPG